MQTIIASLDAAGSFHKAGELQKAEEACRAVLEQEPRNVLALALLGTLCHEQGRHEVAIDHFRQAMALQATDPSHPFQLGLAQQAAGKIKEAIASYRQVLRLKPNHAEAHNNLAVALIGQGKLQEAEDHYRQALAARKNYLEAHNNLGNLLRQRGDAAAAAVCYREALKVNPQSAEAHNNLGLALMRLPNLDEALASFREAVRLKPLYAEPHNNLGLVLEKLGKYDEAVSALRKALTLKPSSPEAHNNLGVVLAASDKVDDAVASYRQALELQADYAEAHNNLGNALRLQGKLEEAITSFETALRIRPDYPEPHNNLGNALRDRGDCAAAIAHFERAVQIRPQYAEPYNNWGIALLQQGKLEQALDKYEKALRLNPDYPEAHLNRALAWLVDGEWQRGWPEYEWRWKIKGVAKRARSGAEWQGELFGGRTVLLYAEQGLGDTLQFIRYAPLVKERGGRVVLECPKILTAILGLCPGIDEIVSDGENGPSHDYHAALLSLPGIFGTTLTSLPADVPYVHADAGLVERWRRELKGLPGFKVGIAWQGSLKYRGDRQRSIPLLQFAPLAEIAGVRLISLQKGFGVEQLAAVAERLHILDLGAKVDARAGAFMDTAAVIANLDLVITSDTAVAHLAGALGVPVWVALPFTADWRWLREGEDCPWYPSLRLFRQRNAGDWPEVFGRIMRKLQTVLAAAAGKPPLSSDGPDANALNTRGIALVNEQKFAEAVACFRQALLLKADHADVHSNLGVALEGLNRRQDALIHFRQALRLKSSHVDAHHNLGMSLLRNGAPQEALEHFQTVVRARPRHAEAHNNLGMALMDQGRTEEAVAAYAEALRLNPDYAEAHVNRAQAWLTLGNLEEGWPEYEWRWKLPGAAARTFRQPRWDGSPLAGKTILLWAEQSLSDTIQFIRYARLLKEQGARVLCQCQRPLARLLSRCPYLDEVFPEGSSIPSFDVHIPLPSLPGIFHSTLRTVPSKVPYLFCDTTLGDRWRLESSTLGGFKIGIAWQAEPKDRNGSQHSIPLPYFAALALPGVYLISLRRAPAPERLAATETPANIIDFGSIVQESYDPWMETAALLNCLDLVITSDGATAHLAGALGVPAWVALALPADWRWLRDREDCPWYPSGRLFRQRSPGDWLDVVRRIRDELPISRA